MRSHDPAPIQILGVGLAGDRGERRRLERQVSRMTVTLEWLHEYASERRGEASVRPKYVRKTIADFEAQIAAKKSRLRELAPRREEHAAYTYAGHIEPVTQISA
jgi:hypothetical protein